MSSNHRIITVSKYAAEKIRQNWLLGKKLFGGIYNIYTSLPENSLLETVKKNKFCTVLTLGHVVWYKNPEVWLKVAVKVASKIPNVTFIWAGDGKDNINILRDKIPHSLRKSILFVGFTRDTSKLYDSAKVYFQPSLKENLSMSVLDAQRRGIPAVVSNVGGLPEIIENSYNGFVTDVTDADKMAECIIKLLRNNKLRDTFSINSVNKYNQMFSYHEWQSHLDNLYQFT